jgi:hypothetical protein
VASQEQAIVRMARKADEMELLTTLRSISNCLCLADSHSSVACGAAPASGSFGTFLHGEPHSLPSNWLPVELPKVGKGVASLSLCSVPTVKVPKASGLDDGDGSGEGEGEGAEDNTGECDTSSSSPLDGEEAWMSSLGARGDEGDE